MALSWFRKNKKTTTSGTDSGSRKGKEDLPEIKSQIQSGNSTVKSLGGIQAETSSSQESTNGCSLLVASIDFGTTYSGWAFSFRGDFERDPIKISAKNWLGQKRSQKGPTCVLIYPDGKTLHSFGYDAETEYARLAEEKEHKDWYFFRRFKMTLYDKMELERNVCLEDATGRSLPAVVVFSLSIQYLREDLLKMSSQTLLDCGLTDDEVHWVLTVPAIWTDAAKQFMREAAEIACIPRHKLTICLEPEAASLFCRYLPVEKTEEKETVSLGSFKTGMKYLVVDAGGGTVDTTVHEVVGKNAVRELHTASGGAWGGTKVDEAFETFLDTLFGQAAFSKFKENHMEDYIELFKDFEVKKTEISLTKESKTTIGMPLSLLILAGKELKTCVADSISKEHITVVNNKLRLDADLMRSFFNNPIEYICCHIGILLRKPVLSGCATIVLVGGFSESPLLMESIHKRFSGLRIIRPDDAGLTVMKGAVLFGHAPLSIQERICKFTYGQSICHLKTENCEHPETEEEPDDDGEMFCNNIFDVHARLGQAVKIGEQTEAMKIYPIFDDQENITYDIYASSASDPQLVTESSCKKIGSFSVPIPDKSLGRRRPFEVSFKFGGTEIEVKVVDKVTGQTTIRQIDFLG